jgi:hypothetical protein
MSVERDELEFQRYLEYQRTRRAGRVETLGGAATQLFLATIDMGVLDVSDPASEPRTARSAVETDHSAEVIPLRASRERRLAGFAAEHAELGYAAQAA